MSTVELLEGDCRELLKALPDESVHCVVSSPPFWGLRDYGTDGQLGLEATPDEYVATLLGVFREVHRVLRRDGTLWLNLGDCYATGAGKVGDHPGGGEQGARWKGYRGTRPESPKAAAGAIGPMTQPNRMPLPGLKPKDLVGIPWRVAFALQADGWWLRSDVVWAKRAPMPESVTDRPTRSHEFLFLLAKSGTYFYDHEAIREPDAGMASGNGFAGRSDHRLSGGLAVGGTQERWTPGTGRTKRDVWLLGPEPYPGAHFAVMPTKLVEPCVLAGTSERGCCSACGAPWRRLFEATGFHGKREPAHQPGNSPTKMDSTGWQPATRATGEWEPTCVHSASTQPCTVLDPFAGSGTVGVVALKHNRNAILLELNSSYCNLIRQRIDGVQRRLPIEEVS